MLSSCGTLKTSFLVVILVTLTKIGTGFDSRGYGAESREVSFLLIDTANVVGFLLVWGQGFSPFLA